MRYFCRSRIAPEVNKAGAAIRRHSVFTTPLAMRVLIFHGYLLRGTGSNVYNADVAQAMGRLGHEVHLLAQDRAPEDRAFVDAVGTWDSGRLEVEVLREPVKVTVYRPDIGGLLPVYVADRYDGIEARPFPDLSDDELDGYLEANVAAAGEVAERAGVDVALANHVVMGPAVLARALGPLGIPYAVKIHGSALEYTVKPHPRFMPYAREGLAPARGILVGSAHTAQSLWAAMADPSVPERTRLGPPGVDVAAFHPRPPGEARAALDGLVAELEAAPPEADEASAFARDTGAAAAALRAAAEGLDRGDRLVTFVGKLIVSKGVDLLVAAWPRVLARVPDARLVIVGFGAYRATLERLAGALADGDLETARAIAAEGRAAEGGPRSELRHLRAALDAMGPEEVAAATGLRDRVHWVGRLEHGELTALLPNCEAQVVPSTFPEAFGMVAAEAAACGAFPISAAHSGLAEVSRALAAVVPEEVRPWLSFAVGDDAVADLADRIVAWLEAPEDLQREVRSALAAEAARRYGWEGVAEGVIAAAEGRLASLPTVPSDTMPRS
jgi:glycosyltransferase involved in cell wall biosynthesis